MNPRCMRSRSICPAVAAVVFCLPFSASAQTTSATFGDVIALQGGTPSDIVLDESRHRLYLVGNSASRVDIFDYSLNQLVGSISVGKSPIAAAMSMDSAYLYVTSGATPTQTASGTPLLNVIDLTNNRVIQSVTLPSIPQGVEVGNDGRALVAMMGTGVVSGVPQNTLAVFDRTLSAGQQLLPVTVPALPSVPAPLPATTLTRATKIFTGSLLRTPDGQYIVGVIPPTNSSAYVFVYEVASGVVLRNRTVAGSSTVLSMSPDGARFMAGFTLYDTATLTVIAQENIANAPFATTSPFSTQQNIGGSVFTPDGSALYAAFNAPATTTPNAPPNSSTLLLNNPANLGIRLGIKMPESLVAKMVILSDGSEAWGLSDSGLLHLPLGRLYEYPIIAPESTQIFLASDSCNRGIATGVLRVNNLGKGRMTFSVVNPGTAAVVYQQSSGLAPANITFTMEPGRSGVTRYPGTNLWTGAGTATGSAVSVTLSSPEAINIPPTLRIYMNYRQSDQRGMIYPVPTGPNSGEGLQDILLDEARGRVYITNSAYNRIEVFDTTKQRFVDPIPVGQMPHQMALATDGTTLYVGNTGGETISIVDLDMGKVVDTVQFPPIPRQGNANVIYPRTLAYGLFGLEFIMSDGSQWKVVSGNQATVRPIDNYATTARLTATPTIAMLATADSRYILTLNGSGLGYLYDSTADTYVASRQLITASGTGFGSSIQGYYGVLGSGPTGNYFLVDGLIVNKSLVTIGGSASPSSSTINIPIPGGGIPGGATVVNTGQRNVAAVAGLTDTTFLRLTTSVRQSITSTTTDDSRTTLDMINLMTGENTLLGVAPENPMTSVFGTARSNVTPRNLAVDSAGTTAYALTLSGISLIPLARAGADTRPTLAGANAVVNASDGSQDLHPGSFITISGAALAAPAVADTIPPPTILGGSCVTFGDVALPLLQTSSGAIQAQIPDTLRPGTQVVEVRSLATAQQSDPVTVTVKAQ